MVDIKPWYKRIKVMIPLVYVALVVANELFGLGIDKDALYNILYAVGVIVAAEFGMDVTRFKSLMKVSQDLIDYFSGEDSAEKDDMEV